MRQYMRRGLIASLLLFIAVFAILVARLDALKLQQDVSARLVQMGGQQMHSGQPSLSLLHGASLKLPAVRIGTEADAWHFSADVVRIDISLWSLLTGELHFTDIDMIRPVLHLRRGVSPQVLFTKNLPDQVGKLRIRQGKLVVRGEVVAENVLAVVRRIDREKQTTWEVQSRFADGNFSTQGYVRSDKSGQRAAFGRISATQLHMQKLHMLPLPPSHYDFLDTSLTFSFTAEQQWQWAGNVLTHDGHDVLPDLAWRGKIRGSGWRDFHLHDAFLSFGDKSRLQLAGGCQRQSPCELDIHTHAADAKKLLSVFSIEMPLRAKLDAAIQLRELKKGWQITGDLGLQHVRWSATKLPDVDIKLSRMRFAAADDFELSRASIRPVGGSGELFLSAGRHGKGKGFVAVSLKNLDAVWAPLGNIVLQSYGWNSRLSGNGPLSGSLEWHFKKNKTRFGFDINATSSDITLGEFSKPTGMRAEAAGQYFDDENGKFLQLGEIELGDSYLKKSGWPIGDEKRQAFVGSSRIDIDALRASGLKLPEKFMDWHGQIEGGVDDFSMAADQSVLQRLAAADGSLHMKEFGFGDDAWSGKIKLKNGRMVAMPLRWQHSGQFTDTQLDMNLRSMQGELNLLRGHIEWSVEDGIPVWLKGLRLHGDFSKLDLIWSGNRWQDLHGGFSLADDELQLSGLRGQLADGSVQSRRMRLKFKPKSIDFDGRMQMSAVHLDRIEGLKNATGADMEGYIFFNGLMRGSLPPGSGQAWRGNGDIEIHRGHWKSAKAAHFILWKNEVAGGVEDAMGERFSRLTARFHFQDNGLELKRLKFNGGSMVSKGDAGVSPQGDIGGHLSIRSGEQRLTTDISGRWPSLTAFFPPATTLRSE
ncbi:MAG: hypothetical protein R8K53_02045 [Mariprofundaceae bacterium]